MSVAVSNLNTERLYRNDLVQFNVESLIEDFSKYIFNLITLWYRKLLKLEDKL